MNEYQTLKKQEYDEAHLELDNLLSKSKMNQYSLMICFFRTRPNTEQDYVRITRTNNVHGKLADTQRGCPTKIEPIRIMEDSLNALDAICKHFRQYQIYPSQYGGWFKYHSDMLTFGFEINRLILLPTRVINDPAELGF